MFDDQTRAALRLATANFVVSRAVLLLIGWITLSFIATRHHSPHGVSASLHSLKMLTCRWDCGWYMSIATHGYSAVSPPGQPFATNLAFWPAFPYLARYLHDASGLSILTGGVILSNVALLIALILVYKYCITLDFKARTAALAVSLLAFAPQGFMFSAFYADALMFLGMIGAMYYTRTRHWWIAGLFAILATTSRPTGIVILAFLVVNAYQTLGWRKFFRPWEDARPFIPVVLAPAGQFLVMWMAFLTSGDAFAQVHTRAQAISWMVRMGPPWRAIIGDFDAGPDLKFWSVAALLLAASIIPLIKKRWWPDAVFAICYFVLIFSQYNPEGLLQYAIGLPSVYVGLAWLVRRSDTASLLLLGVFATTGAALFCAWALGTGIAV